MGRRGGNREGRCENRAREALRLGTPKSELSCGLRLINFSRPVSPCELDVYIPFIFPLFPMVPLDKIQLAKQRH